MKMIIMTRRKDHQLLDPSTRKTSSAAGPKERRWTLFDRGAGERRNSKPLRSWGYRFSIFWSPPEEELHAKGMKRGINTNGMLAFALLAGEGRVPSENVPNPRTCCLGVGEPGFLQAGGGNAVRKNAQSTTAPPMRPCLKFSRSLRFLRLWLLAQVHRAQVGVKKVHLHLHHLPLGGVLWEGTR